jgi:uncharacterized membrane protein
VEEITLPGYLITYLTSLNERGDVAGFGLRDSQTDWARPFTWSGGQIRMLPLPKDAVAGIATGINAKGEVSGTFFLPEKSGAVVWSGNRSRGLMFCGAGDIWASGIGHDGAALCGAQSESQPEPRSFLWTQEEILPLGPFIATDRDTSGGVIGITGDCERGYRAVTFREGKISPLPMPGQYKESVAVALNERGQIAGAVVTGKDLPLPALWEENGRRLRLLDSRRAGQVLDINDGGVAVGVQETGDKQVPVEAVLWKDGKSIPLADAVSDSDWTLYAATGINNRGQIIGLGERNGRPCGFRLTPTQ